MRNRNMLALVSLLLCGCATAESGVGVPPHRETWRFKSEMDFQNHPVKNAFQGVSEGTFLLHSRPSGFLSETTEGEQRLIKARLNGKEMPLALIPKEMRLQDAPRSFAVLDRAMLDEKIGEYVVQKYLDMNLLRLLVDLFQMEWKQVRDTSTHPIGILWESDHLIRAAQYRETETGFTLELRGIGPAKGGQRSLQFSMTGMLDGNELVAVEYEGQIVNQDKRIDTAVKGSRKRVSRDPASADAEAIECVVRACRRARVHGYQRALDLLRDIGQGPLSETADVWRETLRRRVSDVGWIRSDMALALRKSREEKKPVFLMMEQGG